MSVQPPETIDLSRGQLIRQRINDADGIAAAVAVSLEHLRPWMPWAGAASTDADHQRERCQQVEQQWDENENYIYVLRDGSGGPDPAAPVAGVFGLHRRVGPGAIEIGYWVHVEHVGQGHATRAAGALTDAALELIDVDRVEIHTDEANLASAAVPRKLGYDLARVEVRDPEAPGESGRLQIWTRTR